MLAHWAKLLNCGVGKLPFVYLALPIGARPSDKRIWKSVVDRMEGRLAKWENKFLSFGGRMVLTNAVLSPLPIYFLFFLQSP